MKLIPVTVLAGRERRYARKHGFQPTRKIPGTSFIWGQVVMKSGAFRMPRGGYTLPNGDPVRPWYNAILHARNLQRLRNEINRERKRRGLPWTNIAINSWWRTWRHNQEVGGAEKSQHLYLLATDITREEVARLTPWDHGRSFDRIADRIFSGGGFGEYPSGARHVDTRGFRARWTSWGS